MHRAVHFTKSSSHGRSLCARQRYGRLVRPAKDVFFGSVPGLLAGQDLALEHDLADVEPIAQKMGERAAGEWETTRLTQPLLATAPVRAKNQHTAAFLLGQFRCP